MKFVIVSSIFLISFNLNSAPLIEVNFNDTQLGLYEKKAISQDWPNLKWQNLSNRAEIVNSHPTLVGKTLKINYPKSSVGPSQGGGQFVVPLKPVNELWLSYQVKFDPNFDFRLGGKLPGLTSGGSKFTGGTIPSKGEGWSARYMWRKNGEAVIYLYHMNMQGKWGDDLALGDFHFKPNTWHTLVQHIRVNDMQQSTGVLEVWIDGTKQLSRHNIQFRGQVQAVIDAFFFSTFHGGNTARWGPKHDSFAYFDNFIISKTPLLK